MADIFKKEYSGSMDSKYYFTNAESNRRINFQIESGIKGSRNRCNESAAA